MLNSSRSPLYENICFKKGNEITVVEKVFFTEKRR